MVITRKEAEKITDEEQRIVGVLESRIDELILKNSKSRITNHALEVPGDLEVTQRVFDRIEKLIRDKK